MRLTDVMKIMISRQIAAYHEDIGYEMLCILSYTFRLQEGTVLAFDIQGQAWKKSQIKSRLKKIK